MAENEADMRTRTRSYREQVNTIASKMHVLMARETLEARTRRRPSWAVRDCRCSGGVDEPGSKTVLHSQPTFDRGQDVSKTPAYFGRLR